MRTRIRVVLVCLLAVASSVAAGESASVQPGPVRYGGYYWLDVDGLPLPFQSNAQLEKALHKAKVKKVTQLGTGASNPRKLLLKTEDTFFHASFKDINVEERNVRRTVAGKERFFPTWKDSYRYDIAAYELDKLLGLDRVPPSVKRGVRGRHGAVTLWLEGTINEAKRRELEKKPPELAEWNQQLQLKYLFDNLVADRDPNLGNTLIDTEWRLWFIDCSRCFGSSDELLYPGKVTSCERTTWDALQALTPDEAHHSLGSTLGRPEIDALLARRDKLVELIQGHIDRWGEAHVIFDLSPSAVTEPSAGD